MSKGRAKRVSSRIEVSPVGDQVAFFCPGCQQLHHHRWRGDGHYLPRCPPGGTFWRSGCGYFLVEVAE